ncbi:hypothetical protein ABPG75_006626 [Micractinium tetrahymenae]
MRSRSARLGVMGALLVALLYTLSPRQPAAPVAASQQQQRQQQSNARELAEEEPDEGPSLLGEVFKAAEKPSPRPKYSLSEELRVQAIMNGSQQHGQVAKAGPLRADFWTLEKRPWREAAFMRMVVRDMAQPRQPAYWEADASGQLALKPLPLPFPLCHTYVNHKYRVIFIIHPKSASTATKRYMTLCRLNQTESCLEPLERAEQLQPLEQKWSEYFVFTFVRNPWARAYSSWKFLREGYMLKPGQVGKEPGAAPCVEAGWRDFCGDPLVLGRVCLAQPGCCPGREKDRFMFYHVTDQATCLVTEGGGLAVDFIGRVEHVDEDMKEAVRLINSRLPQGVPPLQLPDEVAAINVGPEHEDAKPPDNSRYVPAYLGANTTCFSLISRFYEKDVALMFPALHQSEQRAAAVAALPDDIALVDRRR